MSFLLTKTQTLARARKINEKMRIATYDLKSPGPPTENTLRLAKEVSDLAWQLAEDISRLIETQT